MKTLLRALPFASFMPFFAFAQVSNPGNLQGVSTFLKNIISFMNGTLVPGIFAIAFLVFIWGVFQTFILGGSDEDKQEEGKKLMMYSIAGFVVMISLWGVVNLVASGFGFQGQNVQNIPNLPVNNN